MDARFRPPKKSDDRQWAKVIFLVEHGFRFQKVYDKQGGVWTRVRYPSSLEDALLFVKTYRDQAFLVANDD